MADLGAVCDTRTWQSSSAESAIWRVSLVADVGSFPGDCDVV